MIDEIIKSPSNSPAIGGTGSGGHACGVGRIYFDPAAAGLAGDHAQGVTALLRRLEEAFCEVVNE
jgi:hypothetical protein